MRQASGGAARLSSARRGRYTIERELGAGLRFALTDIQRDICVAAVKGLKP